MQDLGLISSLKNVIPSFGNIVDARMVRFTGCRNKDLEEAFSKLGFDADGDKSVTKKTDILIIPYKGFSSSKLNKIDQNKCLILTEDEAYQYINNYASNQTNFLI